MGEEPNTPERTGPGHVLAPRAHLLGSRGLEQETEPRKKSEEDRPETEEYREAAEAEEEFVLPEIDLSGMGLEVFEETARENMEERTKEAAAEEMEQWAVENMEGGNCEITNIIFNNLWFS